MLQNQTQYIIAFPAVLLLSSDVLFWTEVDKRKFMHVGKSKKGSVEKFT